MINEHMQALGAAPNKIRETYAYGLERKALLGDDKVFDLSIGNPSVPAPEIVDQTIARLALEGKGEQHGYTPSPGLASVRQAVADDLNRKHGTSYTGANVYLTSGASSCIAITYKALVCPGEESICITPYFPEYKTWTENAGGVCVEVPARQTDFQLDVPAIEAAITDKTAIMIINSPNNPVGSVYTDENLNELADMLRRKSAEIGHDIYLIADEPYRELVYSDHEPAWVPDLYAPTIVCYSWSKSFSLPGERIGYVLVPDTMPDWQRVFNAISGGGRALGYICAGTMFQNVVAECIEAPVNIEPYRINRDILVEGLRDIGYTFVEPDGAFYVWIKALEDDANAFYEQAKKHELLLVPSDGFGVKGWVRASYCVSEQTVRGAVDAFRALWEDYQ